jgi:hypothetical protein
MVIDYSERRQSQRMKQQPKRPTRPSVWPYALVILVMLVFAFLTGVGTGWYLFRPGGKFCKVLPQAQAQPQAAKPAPQPPPQPAPPSAPPAQPQGQPLNALPPATTGAPVPLTFYNTLQKGNKELMGTGINQPKPAPQPPAER